MASLVVSLLFPAAAVLALVSVVTTWRRYGPKVAATLATARTVDAERSFLVRVVATGVASFEPRQRHWRSRHRSRPATVRTEPALPAAA